MTHTQTPKLLYGSSASPQITHIMLVLPKVFKYTHDGKVGGKGWRLSLYGPFYLFLLQTKLQKPLWFSLIKPFIFYNNPLCQSYVHTKQLCGHHLPRKIKAHPTCHLIFLKHKFQSQFKSLINDFILITNSPSKTTIHKLVFSSFKRWRQFHSLTF